MDIEKYKQLTEEVKPFKARIIAVSKTKPVEDVMQLYEVGHRLFGENKVQELSPKYEACPKDIEWHIIGHLQTNKVKYVAPFIGMIESVDSLKLLSEINKQAEKLSGPLTPEGGTGKPQLNKRVINCLLQVCISEEETKFGLSIGELYPLLESKEFAVMKNICICGLMGMATNTVDEARIEKEFTFLKSIFEHVKQKYFANDSAFKELSMGMTSDYKIALKCGATLIRVGSLIFGGRTAG